MLDRITVDPKVMHGQPCIRGMRLPVHIVLDLLAHGMTAQEVLDTYPELEAEDIRQCLEYAAWLAKERTLSVEVVARD